MSQRSISCEKSVTIDYPSDRLQIKISRDVFPEDPDEPGVTFYTVDLSGQESGQARFLSLKNLERYHKAIGYFLDQLDKEGGD